MSRLIGMTSLAVIVYYGLKAIGLEIIEPLLEKADMIGAVGSVTGLVAFGVMGLLLIAICFKS